MVGCCVARLAGGIPGVRVTLVDIDAARAEQAAAVGVRFATPDDAPGDQDVVFHASATAAGLQRGLELLRPDGTVVEMSWYGDTPVPLPLGGAFHSQRLAIRGSQVGAVPPGRRGIRSLAQRRALALELLRDSAFDTLLTGSSPFDDLPDVLARLADGSLSALCHTISYPEA